MLVLLLFLSINDVKALLFLSVIAGRMSIKNLISWSLAVFLIDFEVINSHQCDGTVHNAPAVN